MPQRFAIAFTSGTEKFRAIKFVQLRCDDEPNPVIGFGKAATWIGLQKSVREGFRIQAQKNISDEDYYEPLW